MKPIGIEQILGRVAVSIVGVMVLALVMWLSHLFAPVAVFFFVVFAAVFVLTLWLPEKPHYELHN